MPSKPKHQQSHDAVNTPPSRDPQLMRKMYALMAKLDGGFRGREATIIGSLVGLLGEDTLTISHARSIPDVVFAESARPELFDFAPISQKSPDLTATAHIAIAAGYALNRTIQQLDGLVLAYAGEAASLESARETLAFAFMHKLPLVVIVQHNLAKLQHSYAVHDLSYEVLPAGLPGITVDGSDAMAVYRVTQEAMFRARHEGGPTLIECKTYPKRTIPTRFRPWVQGDAVGYMEEQLRARGFWE